MAGEALRARRLDWGVKQSFCGYVQSAGGTIETAAGATRREDGAFSFVPAPDSDLALSSDGVPVGAGRFLGEVKFSAHGGMLSVLLADPAVEIGPAGAVLTVAEDAARKRRLQVAKLDLSAAAPGEAGETVIPAALTLDGHFYLGDHYPPGTALDPVRVWWG